MVIPCREAWKGRCEVLEDKNKTAANSVAVAGISVLTAHNVVQVHS